MSASTLQQAPVTTGQPAGLLRRCGAMVSDALVVLGLLILTTFVTAPPLLSMLGKKAIVPSEVGWLWTLLYWCLMLSVWAAYFVLLWSRNGQTVGMRAWRIQLQTLSGALPTIQQSLRRLWWATLPWMPGYLVLALAAQWQVSLLKWAGLTFLLMGLAGMAMTLFDPAKRAWHDKISQGKVILLPKP